MAATRDAMELNPLTTYSLHQKASHDEIRGKGERRKTVTPDLELMRAMKKTDPMPSFAKVDFPKTPGHKPERLHKLVRDTGQLYGGNDDLSELELDSDEEYTRSRDCPAKGPCLRPAVRANIGDEGSIFHMPWSPDSSMKASSGINNNE